MGNAKKPHPPQKGGECESPFKPVCQRYKQCFDYVQSKMQMVQTADGEWVKHSEHVAQVKRLCLERYTLERRCAELERRLREIMALCEGGERGSPEWMTYGIAYDALSGDGAKEVK